MVNIVLIGIGFILLYYWIFFATGSIVINLLKIKTGNNFIAIALGCFVYFFILALSLII